MNMPGGRRGGDEAGPDLGEVLAVVCELDLGVAAGEGREAALGCNSTDTF